MSSKEKSLIGGISILSVAGLICKVVGVLYKIPLANTIGPMGIGVYHQVFPTYNLLLTVSSAGLPVAISRMVAASVARGEKENARRVFRTALALLAVLGFLGTMMMIFGSGALAHMKNTPACSRTYLAIAPSLLLVCLMSAYRGFMQGRRRMAPTAVSQLIEQVGKVFIAMPFAAIGMWRGGYAMGAAGAMLGTTVAEFAALVYMMVDARFARDGFEALPEQTEHILSARRAARELLAISIPITIGACIVPIAAEVDSFMLVSLMENYFSEQEAVVLYGMYTGLVFPLINVPTALAMAAAVNLVPAISAAYEKKNAEAISREAETGLRFAVLVGLPSSVGMSMLAEPILTVLFGSNKYTPEMLANAASLLQVSALTILWFTLVQATSGILQGLHKQRIPMYTLAVGVALKIALNYTLVRIPHINIHGAPYASLLCYVASFLPNLYYVIKYGKVRLRLHLLVTRPAVTAAVMAAFVAAAKALAGARLHHSLLLLILIIAGAAAVYGGAAVLSGAVTRGDLPRRFQRKGTK